MRTHIFVRTHRFLQNNIFPLPRVAGGDVVGLDQEVVGCEDQQHPLHAETGP